MKPLTRAFLIAQELDILMTLYAVWVLGFRELNPLGLERALVAKLFVTIGVAVLFERVENWPRLVWLVPGVAFLPIIWNAINLIAQFIF